MNQDKMLGLKATMVRSLLSSVSPASCPPPLLSADFHHPLSPSAMSERVPAVGLSAYAQSIIDNSGALVAECVNVLKQKTGHGMAGIGASTRSSRRRH